VAPALLAQQPFIDSVGYFGGLQPGGLAIIEGGFFDATLTVQVGGVNAPMLGILGAWCDRPSCEKEALIQVPVDLPLGRSDVVLEWNGSRSEPMQITLEEYAPAFVPGSFGHLRIEQVQPDGQFGPWSCSGAQPFRPGDFLRLYVTGLGATKPVVATGVAAPEGVNTAAAPIVMLGGQPAAVVESILAPGEIGIYRLTLKLPPVLEADWQNLTLAIAGKSAEPRTVAENEYFTITGPASPESIQVAYSCNSLIGPKQVFPGDPIQPFTNLGGLTVNVKDSKGVERLAPVLFAGPDRIEYIIPAGTANGNASIRFVTAEGPSKQGTVEIRTVAPRGFTTFGSPAMFAIRDRGGAQSLVPVAQELAHGGYEPVPIDLGTEAERVYLNIFGTGWRFGSNASIVIEGTTDLTLKATLPADFAGAHNTFAGLDQMNVLLPHWLSGWGEVKLYFDVDGEKTGVLARLSFK
jgi:uncharacterized protein (TIGR03437 family)